METLIIAALIIVGLVFFLIEVFLIPGISIAGILSAISLIYACFLRFYQFGNNCWTHYDRRIWLRSDSRYHMVHEVENRRQAVAA